MIRRPLNERFAEKVLAGIKTTTIRDKEWPVGVPIMLFRWSGKPYRSKQINIAPVVVERTGSIDIWTRADGVKFLTQMPLRAMLWKSEGFNSKAEMDEWFRPLVKPGKGVCKAIMQFRLWTPDITASQFTTP